MGYPSFTASVVGLMLLVLPASAHTEEVADFYRGKQVRLIIGHEVGGDYDLGGRLLGKYIAKHIPGNPTVVVQNMPGANSVTAANYLYNIAPQDGTVFGSFSRNIPIDAVRGSPNLKVDPRRLGWIGATSFPSRICLAAASSPVQAVGDLWHQELIVGGTGPSGVESFIPNVLDRMLGTKFRVVEGYKGIAEIVLALQKGELQGVCYLSEPFRSTYPQLVQDGKVRILFHAEEAPMPDLPAVPSIFQFVPEEHDKAVLRLLFSSAEFGRPYAAPPNVPEARLAALRAAFAATIQDVEFQREAATTHLDVTAVYADALSTLVQRLYAAPEDVLATAKALLPQSGN